MSWSLTRSTRPGTTAVAAVAPARIIAVESHTIITPPAPSPGVMSVTSDASPCHLSSSRTMRMALSVGRARRSSPLPQPWPSFRPFGARSRIRSPFVLYVTTHARGSPPSSLLRCLLWARSPLAGAAGVPFALVRSVGVHGAAPSCMPPVCVAALGSCCATVPSAVCVAWRRSRRACTFPSPLPLCGALFLIGVCALLRACVYGRVCLR